MCLLLLDDFVLSKFPSAKFRAVFVPVTRHPSPISRPRWPRFITVSLAGVVIVLSIFQMSLLFGARPGWLFPWRWRTQWLAPLRTFNGYGLFAVMTTDRREIIVEGSNDGMNWLPYEFKYKPGDVDRRPGICRAASAASGLADVVRRAGQLPAKSVVREFLSNVCCKARPRSWPCSTKIPFRIIPRATFAPNFMITVSPIWAERRAAGAWWKREFIGEYLPPISLQE